MLSHNSKLFYLLLLSGIVIIFSFSYNIYKEIALSGTCNKSTNFIDGLGGPLELIDQNAKAFLLEKQKAPLSLLYFGYSYCPDICPYKSKKCLVGAPTMPYLLFSLWRYKQVLIYL